MRHEQADLVPEFDGPAGLADGQDAVFVAAETILHAGEPEDLRTELAVGGERLEPRVQCRPVLVVLADDRGENGQ